MLKRNLENQSGIEEKRYLRRVVRDYHVSRSCLALLFWTPVLLILWPFHVLFDIALQFVKKHNQLVTSGEIFKIHQEWDGEDLFAGLHVRFETSDGHKVTTYCTRSLGGHMSDNDYRSFWKFYQVGNHLKVSYNKWFPTINEVDMSCDYTGLVVSSDEDEDWPLEIYKSGKGF